MPKPEQEAKKYRIIGVWDGLPQGGVVNACFPCANKEKLSLCGTPRETPPCEYCQAENIENKPKKDYQ